MTLDVRALALKVMCARCEARPGDPCVSVGGAKASLHAARTEVIFEAYGAGYTDADAIHTPPADGDPA